MSSNKTFFVPISFVKSSIIFIAQARIDKRSRTPQTVIFFDFGGALNLASSGDLNLCARVTVTPPSSFTGKPSPSSHALISSNQQAAIEAHAAALEAKLLAAKEVRGAVLFFDNT